MGNFFIHINEHTIKIRHIFQKIFFRFFVILLEQNLKLEFFIQNGYEHYNLLINLICRFWHIFSTLTKKIHVYKKNHTFKMSLNAKKTSIRAFDFENICSTDMLFR